MPGLVALDYSACGRVVVSQISCAVQHAERLTRTLLYHHLPYTRLTYHLEITHSGRRRRAEALRMIGWYGVLSIRRHVMSHYKCMMR